MTRPGGGINATSVAGRADAPAHLRTIKSLGFSWIRVDAHWFAIEPQAPGDGRHQFSWTAFDAVVRQAAEQGLEVRPMAGYSPAWASVDGSMSGAPRDPAAYAAFVEALLLRYGPYGDFWQTSSGSAQALSQDRLPGAGLDAEHAGRAVERAELQLLLAPAGPDRVRRPGRGDHRPRAGVIAPVGRARRRRRPAAGQRRRHQDRVGGVWWSHGPV